MLQGVEVNNFTNLSIYGIFSTNEDSNCVGFVIDTLLMPNTYCPVAIYVRNQTWYQVQI
jgi:hypothetical protein